tara:strand:- start:50 stop:505 length:456 start_codon:yes stop_codon:yes gene_type:complete
MPVVSINGSLSINEEELSDFVRSEIDSSDFGELMGDAVGEAMNEYDYDQMQSDINDLDGVTDRHDDRLDDVERDIEQLKELATENKEDWKAVREGEISPEVDAALIRQQRRIEELEHAMLSVFEYLHDLGQRDLARGVKRFNDSLTDPTGE